MKKVFAAILTAALLVLLASCSFNYETSDLGRYITLGGYSRFTAEELKAKYGSMREFRNSAR